MGQPIRLLAELPETEWNGGRHRLIYRDIVPVDVRREDEDREPVG